PDIAKGQPRKLVEDHLKSQDGFLKAGSGSLRSARRSGFLRTPQNEPLAAATHLPSSHKENRIGCPIPSTSRSCSWQKHQSGPVGPSPAEFRSGRLGKPP